MKYVKLEIYISKKGGISYHPGKSNYGPLETLSLAFHGYTNNEEIAEWLISTDGLIYSYNAVYIEKLEHNVITVGLAWEMGEYPEISTLFIDLDNFIEVLKSITQLRKEKHEVIIIAQDENDKVICFPSKTLLTKELN